MTKQTAEDHKLNKLELRLFKKLQDHHFKKSGHNPTSNSSSSSMIVDENTIKALRQLAFVLEIPNLIDPAYKFQQTPRFKTAFKTNKQHAILENVTTESERRVLDDDDAEYDRKVKESVVFNFGDDYGNWAESDLLHEGSGYYYLDPIENDDNVIYEPFPITTGVGVKKYSIDQIYKLSSLKEVCSLFS